MQEKISALLDSELDSEQLESVLEAMDGDDKLQEQWDLYHLIGDVMREAGPAHVSITERVVARLQNEPVLVTTEVRVVTGHKTREAANKAWYSVAASLAGIAFVGWVAWQSFAPVSNSPGQISASLAQQMQASPKVKPVAYESRVNDYWVAHRELSGHMINTQDQQVEFVSVPAASEGH